MNVRKANWLVLGVMVMAGAWVSAQTKPNDTSKKSDAEEQSKTNVTMGAARRLDIVFDNSAKTNYTGLYYYSPHEFGDQIDLATSNTNRYMAKFSFGYYLSDQATGKEKLKLRFYMNDGPKGAPKSVLFEVPTLIPLSKGFNSAVLENVPILLPDTFTWTVEFVGMTDKVAAGLLIYNPPTVGFSLDDFWEKVDGQFVLKRVQGKPTNFNAQVIAFNSLPGPGGVAEAVLIVHDPPGSPIHQPIGSYLAPR
jgi:hypothetical protein